LGACSILLQIQLRGASSFSGAFVLAGCLHSATLAGDDQMSTAVDIALEIAEMVEGQFSGSSL